MSQRSRVGGFSLIEVLVALAIVAYVGLSVQQRIGQFLDERLLLTERQQAHWIAWDELMKDYAISRYGKAAVDDKPGKSGEISSLDRHWYYRRIEDSTASKELRRIRVVVAGHELASSSETAGTASLTLFVVPQ